MPQKYKTSSGSLEQATKGNPALKQLLQEIMNWQSNFTDVSGIDPRVPAGVQGVESLTAPGIVEGFSVVGGSGRFQLQVTKPLGAIGVLYYLIQSSETLPFESSITLTEYGPSPNTDLTIFDAEKTLHWRVSCKFTNSGYGSWFVHGAVSSGPLDAILSVTGTANQVIVVDDGDGNITLSLPQSIGTGNSPQFMNIILSGAGGTERGTAFRTGAENRWFLEANSTAEGGSDAGSDLDLKAYDDDGVLIDTPLTIMRAAGGVIVLRRSVTVTGGLTASDFGITSGPSGVDGTFTTVDGKTVTVTKGLTTSIVP